MSRWAVVDIGKEWSIGLQWRCEGTIGPGSREHHFSFPGYPRVIVIWEALDTSFTIKSLAWPDWGINPQPTDQEVRRSTTRTRLTCRYKQNQDIIMERKAGGQCITKNTYIYIFNLS